MTLPVDAALLIVDVQVGYVNDATTHVLAGIDDLLCARAWPMVVASRYHNRHGSPCHQLLGSTDMRDERSTRLCPEVASRATHVIDKHTYAIGQRLGDLLKNASVRTLVIVGVDTHACVLHEALDAFDRCLRPIVLADLCASGDGEEAHEAAIVVLRRAIGEHHIWFGSASGAAAVTQA